MANIQLVMLININFEELNNFEDIEELMIKRSNNSIISSFEYFQQLIMHRYLNFMVNFNCD